MIKIKISNFKNFGAKQLFLMEGCLNFKILVPVVTSLSVNTRLFYKQHFYKKPHVEIGKKLSKS